MGIFSFYKLNKFIQNRIKKRPPNLDKEAFCKTVLEMLPFKYYNFINIKFAKRLLKLLGVKQYKVKQSFGIIGFDKKFLQIINAIVKAYFII